MICTCSGGLRLTGERWEELGPGRWHGDGVEGTGARGEGLTSQEGRARVKREIGI